VVCEDVGCEDVGWNRLVQDTRQLQVSR
jgi:hypothetical protein